MDWIQQAQGVVKWRYLVNAGCEPSDALKGGVFLDCDFSCKYLIERCCESVR